MATGSVAYERGMSTLKHPTCTLLFTSAAAELKYVPQCVLFSVMFNAALHVPWLSSSVLVSINKVTLCQAWLVLGWVTVCGRVNHLGL